MPQVADNVRNRGTSYEYMPGSTIWQQSLQFIDMLTGFLEISELPKGCEIDCSRYAMWEIIKRVDQRDAYYSHFHDFDINEKKVACLTAYWILKLRPLTVLFENELLPRYAERKYADEINEIFAIYVLLSGLKIWSKELHKGAVFLNMNSYFETLKYSFRYRNLSIDAMVLLSESIVTETFNQENTDIV